MKKIILITSSSLFLLILVYFVVTSHWFLTLPFVPHSIRNNFLLNANILPASDDSRSLFVTVNPGFRAEFGDRENPESAFLRFEVTNINSPAAATGDVDQNLLDSFSDARQILQEYHPGMEWQLFSVGIDEAQVFAATDLAQDEEVRRLAKEILGESLVATSETDVEQALSDKQNIKTETKTTRYQGYDAVENLAVAPDVDLQYLVLPGVGIKSEIIIGDRANFDTACLKLLSETGSSLGCDLPSNRFSFLLQLDPGRKLIHSPLSVDGSQAGTYYLTDSDGKYLFRFTGPRAADSQGNTTSKINFEIRPGQAGGEEMENFYIATVTADLNWLIDKERVFPVRLENSLVIDHGELFTGEQVAE